MALHHGTNESLVLCLKSAANFGHPILSMTVHLFESLNQSTIDAISVSRYSAPTLNKGQRAMTSTEFAEQNPTLNWQKAYALVREHDTTENEFLLAFGHKDFYDTSDILEWLGY